MTDHPITPPPELVQQWIECCDSQTMEVMIEEVARWGADQELEACCHLLWLQGFDVVDDLRATRRPKPPSLAEQALEAQRRVWTNGRTQVDWELIRRALERLQELENND